MREKNLSRIVTLLPELPPFLTFRAGGSLGANQGRPIIIPIGFVFGAPAIFLALHSASKVQFLLYFGLGAFFLSWYHGPLTATIHDLVPPHGRATALGFYYLFVNLFSMAIAPVVIGRIADHYNLITSLHVPIFAQLAGAAFFLVVIYF